MGTACSWKLTADCDVAAENLIFETAKQIDKDFSDSETTFEKFMWKCWSYETKWWAPDFVQKLSQKIDVIFKLEATGDEHFTWYFHKGNILSEEEIWERPQFPSRPLFKKRLEVAIQKRAEQKRLREQQHAQTEKQKLENQLADLKAKQEELEKKLAS